MRLPRRERPTPWLGRVPAAGGHPPRLPCGPSCERPVKFRASEVSGSRAVPACPTRPRGEESGAQGSVDVGGQRAFFPGGPKGIGGTFPSARSSEYTCGSNYGVPSSRLSGPWGSAGPRDASLSSCVCLAPLITDFPAWCPRAGVQPQASRCFG